MPSTNNTQNLELNQWIGTDKPKMADFNDDNLKLDAAMGGHLADAIRHLTGAERTAWNAGAPVIGSYVGDGTHPRALGMGFVPSFGVVFAVDMNIVQSVGSTGDMLVYSAFLSKWGCSQGAALDAGEILLLDDSQVNSNCIACLNQSGVTYVYILFR